MITSRFSSDWDQYGKDPGYKVIYFVKTYNIHVTLVVNSDQIEVHLVPTIGKCTWENKGTIKTLGKKIKNK